MCPATEPALNADARSLHLLDTAMNPFIDNQKRSVDLPFGCKDLADALANATREPNSKNRWKLLKGLPDTERYLAGLLLTPDSLSYLSIGLVHTPHRLELTRVRDDLCILLLIDGSDKGRLRRVRKFFRDAKIAPVVDAIGNLSVISKISTRILIYPLPVVAPDAAELLTRVLREGFAIAEETQLYISSNEKSIA
jgi:hypothetical protein